MNYLTSDRPTTRSGSCRPGFRYVAAVASLVSLLSLAACGGGDPSFDIGVVVAGQPVNGIGVQSGRTRNISILVGQSIELDASEPVQWAVQVGGTSVTGSGATVNYQGVTFTVTTLSASRIVLDTSASSALPVSVPITLTAVSTFDSALVAIVDVLITD